MSLVTFAAMALIFTGFQPGLSADDTTNTESGKKSTPRTGACAVDSLLSLPQLWSLTPDKLEKSFSSSNGSSETPPVFHWLTVSRERAHFLENRYAEYPMKLTLFDGAVPVNEIVVDFLESGKLNAVTFNIANRSDSNNMTAKEFTQFYKQCGRHLSKALGARPFMRDAKPAQAIPTDSWFWSSLQGVAVMEYNPDAKNGVVEFFRIRISPRDAEGSLVASMDTRYSSIGRDALAPNVVKNGAGDVWIRRIPMVDQGPKGYCVVATCQRLFEYYGIPCDQHQVAQIADSSAAFGTNNLEMSAALSRIDSRFGLRFKEIFAGYPGGKKVSMNSSSRRNKPAGERDFEKELIDNIDVGIPLIWTLALGLHPESPSVSMQSGGYHMRLIIGYNSKTKDIIFSDSWGRGHEKKRMKLSHAWDATTGIYTMSPTTK